jgi:type IV pilus assembly protein PilO
LLPRIVTLNDISINISGGALIMDATAKTFRYLDTEEAAALKKKDKPAAGAKDKAGAKKRLIFLRLWQC